MQTGIFAVFGSLEPAGAVCFPNCMGFILGGGTGGLPVLGSSLEPDCNAGSLNFCFVGDVRAVFDVGMGRRVNPPARLGSSFFSTADTFPDSFGAGSCETGALRIPFFFCFPFFF